MAFRTQLSELANRSVLPLVVGPFLARLADARGPGLEGQLGDDPVLAGRVVAVAAASRSLGRLLITDAASLDVLADLDRRPEPTGAATVAELVTWKQREMLRIAARDLTGLDDLDRVGANLALMADDLLGSALRLAGADTGGLAVIGMGKLGANELNYSSDIDIMFVGTGRQLDLGAARRVVEIGREALRVDTALRPEGRAGALVRSLDSYCAYWDRWARPWEFQALVKARFVAGDSEIGGRFAAEAGERVWGRRLDADAIASFDR